MDGDKQLVRTLQIQAESELSTARVLIGVSSGASLVAAVAMLLYFLGFQESRRCGRRLLFCLHLADAGAACAWLLVFALPSQTRDPDVGFMDPETPSTPPLCYTQAYLLLFFMLASFLWTACFAFHLFQILGRDGKTPELYEGRYHLVAWGVPLLTVLHLGLQQALGYDLVGESGLPWCWLRTWSDFEWASSGVYFQVSVFYGPLLLVLLHNFSTYLTLLYKLVRILSVQDCRADWPGCLSMAVIVVITAKRRDLDQDGVADQHANDWLQLRARLHSRLGLCGTSLPGEASIVWSRIV